MTGSAVFQPGGFASLVARNRIAMPAIHLGRAVDGRPTAELLGVYEERARGGAGVITVGVCDAGGPKREGGSALSGVLSLADDDCVGPMAELARRIRAHGALAGAQIAPFAGYNDPRWNPTAAETEEMARAMGRAAARAAAAGYDFVEMMLSGGSVLSHFVSKALNRFDLPGYSGSLEARLRLPLEAVAAIRAAAGPGLVVAARMHCHEFLEGGYDEEEAAEIGRTLERAGVAALSITGGGHRTKTPQITHQVPPLAFARFARRVVESVSVTTLYGGQVRTLADAEAALSATGCTFVNVGRALLADPDWPAKCAAGREDGISPCMTCCRCFDDVFSRRAVSCAANPRFAAPPSSPRLPSGARREKALVVGGGPAGMQAAIELARLGHDVALCEKEPRLGGRWRAAAALHGMGDLARALHARIAALEASGAQLRIGVEATPELARSAGPDVIVLAVGAAARPAAGIDAASALSPEEAILNPGAVGRRAVIVGGGGVGLSLAVHLARSREVTVVKRGGVLGRGIGRSVRWTVVQEAERLGVRIYERTADLAVSGRHVAFLDERAGARVSVEADTIVLATGYEPRAGLPALFEGAAPRILVIGDARSVAGIGPAIADAASAIAALSF